MPANVTAAQTDAHDQSDFSRTLFVSLELSCLRWLVTTLSPGCEKMSKLSGVSAYGTAGGC